jgi:hypothetical protein
MTTQKPRFGLALMLLSASVLALYPTMTLEKSQSGSAVVSIKADGKAFQNQKGKASNTFSSANLTLYGSVAAKGNGGLELDNLAGSLQIGIANYTITSGSGEVNKKGTIEINAKTSDAGKKLELKLHGSNQGDSVTFDSKESKLSSLYFLSLTGKAIVTMPTTTASTTWSEDDHDDNGHHENRTRTGTVTVTQSNTVTETVTQFQNQTYTITETSTATVTEPRNQTITETVTQTITEPPLTSTVTLTETVTSTVANSTITVTVPSTNSTLTTPQI